MSDMTYYRVGVPNWIVPDLAWHPEFEVEPEMECMNKDADSKTFFACSNCNACSYNFFSDKSAKHVDGINFCPNCGARVIKEVE